MKTFHFSIGSAVEKQYSTDVLDEILALQFVVGWAGEGRCEPARLGWWATDLVDEMGGGDFMARLLPKTAAWAALQAVREAARRQDALTRQQSAEAERIFSLFHLGYELDRQLTERLRVLKIGPETPQQALPHLNLLTETFDATQLANWLKSLAEVNTRPTPAGRRLVGQAPPEPEHLVRSLAAALVPFDATYPQPHYLI